MAKTPISVLQELMVQRKDRLPDYYIENSNGANGFPFKCTVKVGSITAVGYGTTKKDAKHNSARKALEMLGFSYNNTPQVPVTMVVSCSRYNNTSAHFVNYVGKLNECASTHGQPYPTYHDEPIPSLNGMFLTTCSFLQYVSKGYGPKKKDAKQDAARNMLEKLRDKDIRIITLEVENLHIEKEKRIETLTLEIKKNYDKLTTAVDNVCSTSDTFISVPGITKTVFTLEHFKAEIEKRGYTYEIETFQKDPYIMMLKICDTNATIMGKGRNKEQALEDLLGNAKLMLHHGFSLKPAF